MAITGRSGVAGVQLLKSDSVLYAGVCTLSATLSSMRSSVSTQALSTQQQILTVPLLYTHTILRTHMLCTHLQVPAMGGIPGTIVCDHGRLERIQLAPTALEKSAGEHGGLLVLASDGVWDALPVQELSKTLQELNLHDLDDDRRSGKADAYDSIGGSAVARVWDEKIEEGARLYYTSSTILYDTILYYTTLYYTIRYCFFTVQL
jgi:serine/threonine protein phosphatase PrpC